MSPMYQDPYRNREQDTESSKKQYLHEDREELVHVISIAMHRHEETSLTSNQSKEGLCIMRVRSEAQASRLERI